MADEKIDQLRKLNPKERIKRLKELGEKAKSDMDEIDDLIKKSERELRADSVAKEVAPRVDEVSIDRLFQEHGAELEQTAKREAPAEKEGATYEAMKQMYSDYVELQNIAYASMQGSLTEAHLDAIDMIGERLDKTKYKTTSQDVSNVLVASRAALYKIKKYAGLD